MESYALQTLTPRTMQPDARHSGRPRIWTALVSLCVLLLTACGADVNSQLELEENFSGTRSFVLAMADTDVESLSGGIDAATRALESHTPDVLAFEGIEQREEGYAAAFTLSFGNLEDYQNKIRALLEASGVPASDQDMTIELDEQPLMTTLSVEENFYNDDLMGWAAEALVNDGVVDSDATVLTSSGTATVFFDGEEIDTSTSLPRMSFDLTNDHRFEDVGLDVEFLESGNIRITTDYLISADSADFQNNFLNEQVALLNDIEGLAEPVTDSGAQQPSSGSAEPRTITALFSSPDAVSAGLRLLLANEEATFEVQELSDHNSPDVMRQYIGSNWTCENICDPKNLQQLDGETLYPDQWQLVDDRRGGGEFFVEFNRGLPLQQMTAVTRLGFDGTLEQTFEFVVDKATLEGHEDTVAERFSPPANTGSFHTAVDGDKTFYTTTFHAQNAHELTTMINDYLKDKEVDSPASIKHDPITGIWSSYNLDVDLSPIWEVVTGGVEEETTFSVELPAMHSGHSVGGSNERTVVVEDSSGVFTVHANGPTITTIWVAVLTVLFLVVIVVLLLRTRKAATSVWGVPTTSSADLRPYNVQGPKDRLTETEIFAAPRVSDLESHTTTEAPRRHEATKPLEAPGPFPDIGVPSPAQYQELQNRLRKKNHTVLPDEQEPGPADSAGQEESGQTPEES